MKLIFCILLVGCQSQSNRYYSHAQVLLEQNEYENINLTYSRYTCGKPGARPVDFVAKNFAGNKVHGTVCCDSYKCVLEEVTTDF